ncbi:MAG: SUMF1/EgtB/PvdO family nonheme iron enzyme, partial [Candidatus Stygibacter australis]|nr:SUMF1/EgtB/PvdO family nonheme iron enzyme [Candidatus Stygibacter australis]
SLDDISLTSKQLSWDYDLDNIEGFMINRRDDSDWQEEIMVSPDARTWLDTTAAVNKHIQYKIKAVAGENESEFVTSVILDNMMVAVDSFTISQVSASRFLLTWQQDHIIGEEGFVIKRKIDEEVWEEIAVLEPDTQEYEDDLAVRSFDKVYYEIYSFVGDELSPPAAVSSDIFFPGPAAVEYEKLAINRIKLTWQEEINGEEGFYIDLFIDGVTLERYALLDENTTEWIDEQAPLNHDLQYKVHAFAGDNTSNYTVTTIIDNTFPAVSDLVVEQQNVHQFYLSWDQDNIIGEEGFIILRSINEGEFQQIADLAIDTEEFLDDICQRDSLENVAYQIYSYLGEDFSDIVEVDTDIEFILNCILEFEILEISRIKLLWQDTCNGEEGYYIDRYLDGIGWNTEYGTADAESEEWIDENPPVNGNVIYRVRAFCGIYESDCIETGEISNFIPAIEGFNVGQVNIHTYQLTWEQEHIIGEEGLILSRSINDGELLQIAELEADTESYLDDICMRDSLANIAYQIRCYLGEEFSDAVVCDIEVEFPAPTNLTYDRLAVNRISLTWQDNSDGEEGFEIDRQINGSEWVEGYGTTTENIVNWIDENALINQNITYRVRAFAGIYESETLETSEINNVIPPPHNLELEVINVNEIRLTWEYEMQGIEGFRIEKQVIGGVWELYTDNIGPELREWDDNDINYYDNYRINSFYQQYNSEASNVVTVTIPDFVLITSGEYTWGQNDDIQTIEYNYFIMKYEVTNLQYVTYLEEAYLEGDVWIEDDDVYGYYEGDEYFSLGDYSFYDLGMPEYDNYARISFNDNSFIINEPGGYNIGDFDHHPVVELSWFGANAYAEFYGWRLPTEEEWEKAARGMTGDEYPWGNDLSGDRANYRESGDPWDDGTTPVGYYNGENGTVDSPSPYGCYDMCGNVQDWTDSWYGGIYPAFRVLRGGRWSSWSSNDWFRSWYRDNHSPIENPSNSGFRCARTVE